ncbi:MAG: helix-turn-helix transcriptional regulator [Actinobacteria bacterium]|nr:helix-turn-helix transcriptional regulator [Actinomycetota bacterium]
MRAALARHDLSAVYRMLQQHGYGQNTIGALTGQSQPEVSGIIHGRQVRHYDLLARIAHGLGIPPGHLGLAWCTHPDCQLPPHLNEHTHPR